MVKLCEHRRLADQSCNRYRGMRDGAGFGRDIKVKESLWVGFRFLDEMPPFLRIVFLFKLHHGAKQPAVLLLLLRDIRKRRVRADTEEIQRRPHRQRLNFAISTYFGDG